MRTASSLWKAAQVGLGRNFRPTPSDLSHTRGILSAHQVAPRNVNRVQHKTLSSHNSQCNLRCLSSACSDSTIATHSPCSFVRTPQDEQVIRDLFLSFATQDDSNQVPYLRVKDLSDLLLAIGDRPSETTLKKLVEAIDLNNDGNISYDEFVTGCGSILGNLETSTTIDIDFLADIFRTIDADSSGNISHGELTGLLSTAGVSVSEEEALEIIKAADTNQDGKIQIDEFIALMTDPSQSKFAWRIRSGFRVCFIVGGPGSGKGTICEKLKNQINLRHLSSGEMLRAELAIGSPLANSIERTMKEGRLVSSSTIIALLKKQLQQCPGSLVVLDGFPRNKQNYIDFGEVMGKPDFALVIDVPDEEMVRRIMKRAETSGRADDNIDTAHKRIKTYHDETVPTLEQLEASNVPIYKVDGSKSPDEIWDEIINTCPPIGARIK